MAVFSAMNLSTVQLQVQNAMSRSFVSRIDEIEDIIRSTSTKELRNVLPMIVEGIFGFGPEIGWDVDRLNKGYETEFERLRRFLSPDGPLLKLIYNLQSEPYTYEFSVQHIPSPSRYLIEEGIIPPLYAGKLQHQAHGLILALNAFEFYMFHFAYALVSPKFRKSIWYDFYDFLYPNLIDNYLYYFFPLDKNRLPSMPVSTSPVRSPVTHYSISPSNPRSPSPNVSPRKTPRGLFKSNISVASQKQLVPTSPVIDSYESETWRSEITLQIWCEFWLNQNSSNVDRQGLPQGTVISSYALHHGLNTSYERDPFHFLYEHFVPTANHVNVVRVLVKYLHYFVNTANNKFIATPYHSTTSLSPLEEFKRTVVPQILQKKLYPFLKHAFDHWPLDSSFKMVLEIWLSYIQPWRYTDPKYMMMKDKHRTEQEHDRKLEDKWYQFIEDNLLFYTVLFQEFLPRVYRWDLTTFSSTFMLYRVSKVFSRVNLATLIERAERKMCSASFLPSRPIAELGSSYLSFNENNVSGLHPQYADLESPSFQYSPLFGHRSKNLANAILDQMLEAKFSTLKRPTIVKTKRKGFFGWLTSLFTQDEQFGDISPEEIKKHQLYMNAAIRNLCGVFEMPVPIEIQDATQLVDNTLNESNISESSLPDHIQTENGPQLTALGRVQVANGLKKFDVLYYGDPDLEPVKSYEITIAVRLLYQFCEYINTKYADQITLLNNRKDFIGRMVQTFIAPPLSNNEEFMSPVSKVKADHLRRPRLSLRFLANYQSLMYLGILYLVLNLWFGLGPIGFIIVLLILTFIYAMFSALLRSSRQTNEGRL